MKTTARDDAVDRPWNSSVTTQELAIMLRFHASFCVPLGLPFHILLSKSIYSKITANTSNHFNYDHTVRLMLFDVIEVGGIKQYNWGFSI